jgi:signal transduction histidine kinase
MWSPVPDSSGELTVVIIARKEWLIMLCEFIALHRDEIIRRCRAKVTIRSIPPPTEAEINHGVPLFLDQLGEALRFRRSSNSQIRRSAGLHGHDLLLRGFTVGQVVHVYGDVCQSIAELALEMNAPISTDDFRMLNRCLDDAIAGAVTKYGAEQNQSSIDGEAGRASERLGFLAHELRNLTHTAMVAFEVLKTGTVGVVGSTAAVLQRSLVGIETLVGRSLAEVRLTQGVQNRQRFLVSTFIAELTPAATLEASDRGIRLTVTPVEEGVLIEADRTILAAVIANLLQNAFKFTRPGTTVTLRVDASAERVLIEIHDECAGLPDGNINGLFGSFVQRGADRTGLGLGLAFSRWAVHANDGEIFARNLPHHQGCVFTVDLPRVAAA